MGLRNVSTFDVLRRAFAARIVSTVPIIDSEVSNQFYRVISIMRRGDAPRGSHVVRSASLTGDPIHVMVRARVAGAVHLSAPASDGISTDGSEWLSPADTKPGSTRPARSGPAYYARRPHDSVPAVSLDVIINPLNPLERAHIASRVIPLP